MEELVALAKKSAVQNMEIFLRNFSHVPDDKLNWTPVPTAKSALRVAAHTSLYAGRFAKMIRERKLPAVENLDQWLKERNEEECAIHSREDVERVFRAGTEEACAAMDTLTPEEVHSSLDSGQGWSMSMEFLINLPGWHATLHTGQIDYIQTCWDDQEVHLSAKKS